MHCLPFHYSRWHCFAPNWSYAFYMCTRSHLHRFIQWHLYRKFFSLLALYYEVFSLNWIITIGVRTLEIYLILTAKKQIKPLPCFTPYLPLPGIPFLCSLYIKVVNINSFSILPASNYFYSRTYCFTEIALARVNNDLYVTKFNGPFLVFTLLRHCWSWLPSWQPFFSAFRNHSCLFFFCSH